MCGNALLRGCASQTARALIVLLLSWSGNLARATPQAAKLDTARVWVFAVSSLVWKYEHGLNMPKKGREDIDFVRAFKNYGIPSDHIVFLKDRQGTLNQIDARFTGLLDKTQPGDTLFFYFQGHGGRTLSGKTSRYYFYNFDANPKDQKSWWFITDIFDRIQQHFKGDRALMMADCCTSGGLGWEAAKRPGKIAYACLTSVYAHNESTGNWTYTDALMRGFKGDPVMDENNDGVITLEELASYIQREMAFVEGQKAAFVTTSGFPADLPIATATGKRGKGAGQSVLAKGVSGAWEKAEVQDKDGARVQVRYAMTGTVRWQPKNSIRPYKPEEIAVGSRVQAREDGKWYPATVKTSWYGLAFVHYDDYTTRYDDWVGPDNIKPIH